MEPNEQGVAHIPAQKKNVVELESARKNKASAMAKERAEDLVAIFTSAFKDMPLNLVYDGLFEQCVEAAFNMGRKKKHSAKWIATCAATLFQPAWRSASRADRRGQDFEEEMEKLLAPVPEKGDRFAFLNAARDVALAHLQTRDILTPELPLIINAIQEAQRIAPTTPGELTGKKVAAIAIKLYDGFYEKRRTTI